MKNTNLGFQDHMRIVIAITVKDIFDALRNKNAISLIITSLFLVLAYKYMPLLYDNDPAINLLVYDAGESRLVQELDNSMVVDLYTYTSREVMIDKFKDGDFPELGLVIPADFDLKFESGEAISLEGYVLHWVKDQDAALLVDDVESEINYLMGADIKINTEGNIIHTDADSYGYPFLSSIGLIILIAMIGMMMVPHIIIEEKKSKTIDVLMISPANSSHITAAKALTGIFYCLITSAIAFTINGNLVDNWLLAILAVFLFSLFSVSLGLLLGAFLENKQQMMIWSWVIFIPIVLPVFLSIFEGLLPDLLIKMMRWIPSVSLGRVIRAASSNVVDPAIVVTPVVVTISSSILIYWFVDRYLRKVTG